MNQPLHVTRNAAMTRTIQDAINDQIRAEFESSYFYLALAGRMEELNLKGFAIWLRLQWGEETQHALKFYDFLLQRDGVVELKALARPEILISTPLEAFELVLKSEQHITHRIHDLYALAVEEHDYAFQMLLQWFISEQVEEEEAARDIIDNLRLIGDSGASLFLLDREMGQRQPEEEEAA